MKHFCVVIILVAMTVGLSCQSFAAEPVKVNTLALTDLVEQAGSLEDTGYTADSWEALQETISSAQVILEAPSDQAAVDAMAYELHTAVSGLSLASPDLYVPAGSSKFRTGDITSFISPFDSTFLSNGLVVLPQALGIFGIVLGIRLAPRIMRKIAR